MNLSPLDIRRQQFAKAFRGYEPTEVDTFLKQVSDQMEAMLDEVRHANERTREAEAKLKHYEKVELALQEALESARETARRAETSAEAKAKLILEEAELKAERLVHDAERERFGLRQDLAKLNSRQAEVAARLRGFLLSELEILAQFQGDDPVGFIKLQSAEASGSLPPPRAQLSAAEDWERPGGPPAPSGQEVPGADIPPDSLDDLGDEVSEADPEPPVSEAASPSAAASPFETPRDEPRAAGPETAEPDPESWTTPPVEPPADTVPSDEPEPAEEEPVASRQPPAITGGWDLRSLVTGEERGVAASEEERERIRRILDDLD